MCDLWHLEDGSRHGGGPMNHPHALWTGKDGTQTPITELKDAHLLNILRLLYKPETVLKVREQLRKQAKGEDSRAIIDAGSLFDNPAGLAASEHADDLRDLAVAPDLAVLTARWPQLPHLEFEARRRGLRV